MSNSKRPKDSPSSPLANSDELADTPSKLIMPSIIGLVYPLSPCIGVPITCESIGTDAEAFCCELATWRVHVDFPIKKVVNVCSNCVRKLSTKFNVKKETASITTGKGSPPISIPKPRPIKCNQRDGNGRNDVDQCISED